MTATAPLLPGTRPSLYDRWTARIAADPRLARRWAWLAPTVVTLLAGILRLWNLGHPRAFIFDETYYVKDAWTQWVLGYAATWPDEANESFLAGDTDTFATTGSFVVHPPFGKLLIGAGMALFGAESSFGWRIATAIAGTAIVLVLYLVAKAMTGSVPFATVAALLMAIDGLAIVMSRVALLDNFLTLFILLAFWFVLIDRRTHIDRLSALVAARADGGAPPAWGPVVWNRPWIIAAGAAIGAATAVKWSGLYALAGLGVYLVVTDALARRRAGRRDLAGRCRLPAGAGDVRAVRAGGARRLPGVVDGLARDGRRLPTGAGAVGLPPRYLQLPRRPHIGSRLCESGVAVAAAAAPDVDVLPVDTSG